MNVWLLKIAAQVNNRFSIKYENVVVVFFHGLYRTNTEFKRLAVQWGPKVCDYL